MENANDNLQKGMLVKLEVSLILEAFCLGNLYESTVP